MPPTRFALSFTAETETLSTNDRRASFVLRIDPPATTRRRPPLRIVLALDTSGSMRGEKLLNAIASTRAVVQALSADDTFGCVTFNSNVQQLLAPTAMTPQGKQLAHDKLGLVTAEGNTDLSGAILTSLQAAQGGRVLVLTDGCPTSGVVDPDQLERLVTGTRGASSLSAFGFGHDVNPLLLLALAEAGRGNYTFIDPGEPPLAAIAGELGGMLHTVGAQASVTIAPAPGVKIDRCHRASQFTIDATTGVLTFQQAALLADEPVHLAFDLSWGDQALRAPLATATLRVHDTDDGSFVERSTPIAPRFTAERGSVVREAAREIMLARISTLLGHASQATTQAASALAASLNEAHLELLGAARALRLEDDPQLAAALELLHNAALGLHASSAHKVASTRHEMLTASHALAFKRITSHGGDQVHRSQDAFVSQSQRAGWQLFNVPPPDAQRGKKT